VAYRHIKVFVEKLNGEIEKDWYPDSDGIFTGISHIPEKSEVNLQKVYNK
jgi:hypothetical protein